MAVDGMLSLTLKAMGVDPTALLGQAQQLGTAFETLATGQKTTVEQLGQLLAALGRIETNQLTMMAHMGLYVPPLPEGEALELITRESQRYLQVAQAS